MNKSLSSSLLQRLTTFLTIIIITTLHPSQALLKQRNTGGSQTIGSLSGIGYIPDPSVGTRFGFNVATSDDGLTLAVGCPYDSFEHGTLYVLTSINKGSNSYSQALRYSAFSSTAGARIGQCVGISGDGKTIVTGSPHFNQSSNGMIFIVGSGPNGYTERARLSPSTVISSSNALIGTSCAISNDASFLVVGGPGENDGIGAVWTFTYNTITGIWSEHSKLALGNSSTLVAFGSSIALASSTTTTTLAVGGKDDVAGGGIWIYNAGSLGPGAGGWTFTQRFAVKTTANFAPRAVTSVSFSSDGIILAAAVGTQVFIFEQTGSGNSYLFGGSTWIQRGSDLLVSFPNLPVTATASVAVNSQGTMMAAGVANHGATFVQGGTYFWTKSGTDWILDPYSPYVGVGGFDTSSTNQGVSVVFVPVDGTLLVGGDGDYSGTGSIWAWITTDNGGSTLDTATIIIIVAVTVPVGITCFVVVIIFVVIRSHQKRLQQRTQQPMIFSSNSSTNNMITVPYAQPYGQQQQQQQQQPTIDVRFAGAQTNEFLLRQRIYNSIKRISTQYPTKKWIIFISYHQAGASSDANVVWDKLVTSGFPADKIFFDKNSLSDVRELSTSIQASSIVLQLQSSQLYTRPFTLLEMYEAIKARIPILPIALDSYNFDRANEFLNSKNFESALESVNPGASDVIRRIGLDVETVRQAIATEFPSIISLPFKASESNRVRDAQLADIVERLVSKLEGIV
jgi:hypothetical protein